MKFTIGIYDENGNLVKILYDEEGEPGKRVLEWDGSTLEGKRVQAGCYYLRMDVDEDRTVAEFKVVIEEARKGGTEVSHRG